MESSECSRSLPTYLVAALVPRTLVALLKDCKSEQCCLCAVVVSPVRPTAVSHQMRATESARSVDAKRDDCPQRVDVARCMESRYVCYANRVDVAGGMQRGNASSTPLHNPTWHTMQRGTRCNVANNDATWHTTMPRGTQRCHVAHNDATWHTTMQQVVRLHVVLFMQHSVRGSLNRCAAE